MMRFSPSSVYLLVVVCFTVSRGVLNLEPAVQDYINDFILTKVELPAGCDSNAIQQIMASWIQPMKADNSALQTVADDAIHIYISSQLTSSTPLSSNDKQAMNLAVDTALLSASGCTAKASTASPADQANLRVAAHNAIKLSIGVTKYTQKRFSFGCSLSRSIARADSLFASGVTIAPPAVIQDIKNTLRLTLMRPARGSALQIKPKFIGKTFNSVKAESSTAAYLALNLPANAAVVKCIIQVEAKAIAGQPIPTHLTDSQTSNIRRFVLFKTSLDRTCNHGSDIQKRQKLAAEIIKASDDMSMFQHKELVEAELTKIFTSQSYLTAENKDLALYAAMHVMMTQSRCLTLAATATPQDWESLRVTFQEFIETYMTEPEYLTKAILFACTLTHSVKDLISRHKRGIQTVPGGVLEELDASVRAYISTLPINLNQPIQPEDVDNVFRTLREEPQTVAYLATGAYRKTEALKCHIDINFEEKRGAEHSGGSADSPHTPSEDAHPVS